MTQRHRTRPSRQRDPDQVETPFQYPTGSPPRGEFLCRAADPVALPGCRHAAVGGIAAVLHLAEQQQAVPLRHKIDFAGTSAPPSCKDAMPVGQINIAIHSATRPARSSGAGHAVLVHLALTRPGGGLARRQSGRARR